jgi:hypothetical protein
VGLSRRSSLIAWGWCVTYTAITPRAARERRRGEVRSHLWESEHADLPGIAVVLAALRGLLHDIGWALARLLPQVARSFGTPTPYVVLAPLFPVEGWIVAAVATGRAASIGTGIGAVGGGAMLALAALAWLTQRRQR